MGGTEEELVSCSFVVENRIVGRVDCQDKVIAPFLQLQFDLSLERLSVQKKDLIDAQSCYRLTNFTQCKYLRSSLDLATPAVSDRKNLPELCL